SGPPPVDARGQYDPVPRLKRQFDQLIDYNQRLVARLEDGRQEALSILKLNSVERLERFNPSRRDYFWNEVIGRCEDLAGSRAVRSRLWKQQPKWTGYEVQLDLGPDVFAYGILLMPKDVKPGQRRPVVVCQHGLEGRPQQVCDPAIESSYHAFGAKLADLGYIVYAPQNPYIGGN